MRAPLRTALAVVAVAFVVVGVLMATGILNFSAGRCLTDDEIASRDREPYERAAMSLAGSLVKGDAATLHSAFTEEAKNTTQLEQLQKLLPALSRVFPDVSSLHVAHTYVLTSATTGEAGSAICTAKAGETISEPKEWIAAAQKTGVKQAHVVVEGTTRENAWAFVFWFTTEGDRPMANGLWFGTTAFLGKTAEDVWGEAREQARRGHVFNAALLYADASELAYRGKTFQLGIFPEIRKEAQALQLPAELRGQRPFTWTFGSNSFRVLSVGSVAIDGKRKLLIRQQIDPEFETQAEQRNRSLIDGFKPAFPEISESYAAIVVDAVAPGGATILRSTDEVQTPR
jgi:hypothetical protein